MQKKQQAIVPKKIQQDMSVNYFPADTAFNLTNMRIVSTGDSTTTLSIVNEKSNKKTELDIEGIIVGQISIEDYIVLFVSNPTKDKIVKIFINEQNILDSFNYYEGHLNLRKTNPIECISSIESPSIHKIYWVDGINELRVINTKSKLNGEITDAYYDKSHRFEITPQYLNLNDTIKVTKRLSSGQFSQGVIQYAYSYYNFNGIETPIINCTCLNYISTQQGIAKDKTLSCSFNIELESLDTSYDYVRLYSIQRTSLNSTPICKRVIDSKIEKTTEITEEGPVIKSKKISIIDTGLIGDTIDSTLLYYLGGDKIIANTLTSKDNTLFLGNIKEGGFKILQDLKIELAKNSKVSFSTHSFPDNIKNYKPYSNYQGNLLYNANDITTFKRNENYRIGLQFQFNDGSLSDTICLKDAKYVPTDIEGRGVVQASIKADDLYAIENIARARLMFVYPSINDRTRLIQGIISPTVFEAKSRATNYLYAQPSWLVRDNSYKDSQVITNEIQGTSVVGSNLFVDTSNIEETLESREVKYFYTSSRVNLDTYHNYTFRDLKTGKSWSEYSLNNDQGGYDAISEKMKQAYGDHIEVPSKEEWQRAGAGGVKKQFEILNNPFKEYIESAKTNNNYYVDTSLVSFYSPEIESTSNLLNTLDSTNLKLIGIAKVNNIWNDYIITSSNTLRDIGEIGMVFNNFKDKLLICEPLWNDVTPDSNVLDHSKGYYPWVFDTYMWHRNGSLNADSNGDNTGVFDKTYDKAYSLLKNKLFVNVRDCNTIYFNKESDLINCKSKVHLNDYEGFYRIDDITYKGTIDVVNTSSKKYPITGVKISPTLGVDDAILNGEIQNVESDGKVVYSRDPVHIKYKTSNHLLLDLQNKLLPKTLNTENINKINILKVSKYSDSIIVKEVLMIKDLPKNKGNLNIERGTKFLTLQEISGETVFYSIQTVSSINPVTNEISYTSRALTNDINKPENNIGFMFNLIVTGDSKVPNSLFDKGAFSGETVELVKSEFDFYYPKFKFISYNTSNLDEIQIEEDISTDKNYIFIGDIIRDLKDTQYNGGEDQVKDGTINKDGNEIMSQLVWVPISDFYNIEEELKHEEGGFIRLLGYRGDTYFQRWDCLASKPYSKEDKNQVIDIVSCYLESRINLDGRTDKRGDTSINIDYTNFNTINDIYSQPDNYFSSINASLKNEENIFKNNILFSQPKINNSEIDPWTQIKAINSTSTNSNYGGINKLLTYNNNIYFFQDKAIGVVNFNSRVQINPSDGIPIEISNSGRVDGVTYINTNYGCLNKWSIASTPQGIYFVDDYNKSIINFNSQGFQDISTTKGMQSWIVNNIYCKPWSIHSSSIRTLYDKFNSDIYFTTDTQSLTFNETLGEFTSFYSYNNVNWLFNLNNKTYQVYDKESDAVNKGIYELHGGKDYQRFFNYQYDYEITLVANADFQYDKVFENIEFRTNGKEKHLYGKASEYPFDLLTVSNEYQTSFSGEGNLRKKFRTWRWQVSKTISRDRIRNNWAFFKLRGNLTKKVQVYDFVVTYYI